MSRPFRKKRVGISQCQKHNTTRQHEEKRWYFFHMEKRKCKTRRATFSILSCTHTINHTCTQKHQMCQLHALHSFNDGWLPPSWPFWPCQTTPRARWEAWTQRHGRRCCRDADRPLADRSPPHSPPSPWPQSADGDGPCSLHHRHYTRRH